MKLSKLIPALALAAMTGVPVQAANECGDLSDTAKSQTIVC